jgi:hypothetical protein
MRLVDMLRIHRAIAPALISLALACGKQGEGERCDPNSANLDCELGLICWTSDQLSNLSTGAGLCCPPDDVQSSVSACQAGAELPDDMDPPAEDAGAGDAGP